MNEMVAVALISGLCTAIPSLAATLIMNRKNSVLMEYRLEQLEEKMDKHNSVIERTYNIEEKLALQEEKMKVANHRIEDLEKKE